MHSIRIVVCSFVVLVGLASAAPAVTLTENFDSLPEGVQGFSIDTGSGIRLMDMDTHFPGEDYFKQFVIEHAVNVPWPSFTAPSYINGPGYSPGPGGGAGRFGSMRMTFYAPVSGIAGVANSASIDVLSAPFDVDEYPERAEVLRLIALRHGAVVGTGEIAFEHGFNWPQYKLGITGVLFDELMVVAGTTPVEYALAGFDNVVVELVPEPSGLVVASIGLLSVLYMGRRRFRR